MGHDPLITLHHTKRQSRHINPNDGYLVPIIVCVCMWYKMTKFYSGYISVGKGNAWLCVVTEFFNVPRNDLLVRPAYTIRHSFITRSVSHKVFLVEHCRVTFSWKYEPSFLFYLWMVKNPFSPKRLWPRHDKIYMFRSQLLFYFKGWSKTALRKGNIQLGTDSRYL